MVYSFLFLIFIVKELDHLTSEIKSNNISGYHGILIDLIVFDDKLKNSIELIGKNKLFDLVVEDLKTAKKIIEISKKLKISSTLNFSVLDWYESEGQSN